MLNFANKKALLLQALNCHKVDSSLTYMAHQTFDVVKIGLSNLKSLVMLLLKLCSIILKGRSDTILLC